MDDELLDLVDRDDRVLGTINRKNYATFMSKKLGYLRAVDLFIVNSAGKVFTPVRTAHKTIAPNGLDFSVGGHVSSGDDYLSTVVREAEEELYLHIAPKELEFLAKIISEEIRYIRCVYVLRTDTTPSLNTNDFVKAEWLLPDELVAKIDSGHPAKMTLRETVLLLKDHLKNS